MPSFLIEQSFKEECKMTYIDGFLFPIARKNMKAYLKMAKLGGKIWMKHGALAYKECVQDDVKTKGTASLAKMAGVKKGEVVCFSFIGYKSRAHRDAVNKKVMKDPAMNMGKNFKMPFNPKRMGFGGFKSIVDL